MKVLVTGGAGFIGSFIVDELIERGHTVTVYDNLCPQVHIDGCCPGYLHPDARFVKGDVLDYDALKEQVVDAEVVFHEAAAVGVIQGQYQVKHYVDVNISGTGNLLDILANSKHNVKKVIVASSMSAYGEGVCSCPECGKVKPGLRNNDDVAEGNWELKCPSCGAEVQAIPTDETTEQTCNSIYAITKKTQEEMVLTFGRTYDLPAVALRYFNVYGPRQSMSNPYTGVAAMFMSRIKNDKVPIIFEDGRQTRDFVSVHDIVQANLLAMEKDEANYHVFNVGTQRQVSILDVAEILGDLYGKQILPEITGKFRKGDVRHCFAGISRIRDALGFAPRIEFREGMAELIDWAHDADAIDKTDQANKIMREKGLI